MAQTLNFARRNRIGRQKMIQRHGYIGIGNYRIRWKNLPVLRRNPGNLPMLDVDLLHRGVRANFNADFARQSFQRGSDAINAALRIPSGSPSR